MVYVQWVGWSVAAWCVMVIGFVSVMHAKAIKDRGDNIHWSFKYPILLVAVLALLIDILWNVTVGNFIYLEWAKELTFSSRCHRHKNESFGWQRERAVWWCAELSKYDPNHC